MSRNGQGARAIAGLQPDLIIGLYTDMNEQQYGLLSQIAPTIAPSGDWATVLSLPYAIAKLVPVLADAVT